MSTVFTPVYPSQLEAFKAKADLLAHHLNKSFKVKVSKFKRYDYLSLALGHNGHDRLIENAKQISQSDKGEPLTIFTKSEIRTTIFKVFSERFPEVGVKKLTTLCEALAMQEAIENMPGTCIDDIKQASNRETANVLTNVNMKVFIIDPPEGRLDYKSLASLRGSREPKSFLTGSLISNILRIDHPTINQIDIGASLIKRSQSLACSENKITIQNTTTSPLHVSTRKHCTAGHLDGVTDTREADFLSVLVSDEDSGISRHFEFLKHKNEQLEASITKENVTDYLRLLKRHTPHLKSSEMRNQEFARHMLMYYDIPMSVTRQYFLQKGSGSKS